MARKIKSTAEAVESSTEETAPEATTGAQAVFINNLTNREFKFDDGTSYKFKHTREVVTDPTLIANLLAVVARPDSRVFCESQTSAVMATEPESEPEAEEPESTQPADETAAAQ